MIDHNFNLYILRCLLIVVGLSALPKLLQGQDSKAQNPIIHADVPDWSIIRVDDTYYMSSTTMHMSPGLPIMKSKDLVNWEIIGYAYETLADKDDVNLSNGKNMYGRGSWASCLRYNQGTYYVSTFSATTNKTYVFTTDDIESGQWMQHSFEPSLHDHTIFFDDDGKIYIIWGGGQLKIAELKPDFSGLVDGSERVLIENAHAPIKTEIMLNAEGSQLFKVNGKYYLFNIAWPRGGMRTVIIHRADKITGPYEGRVAFEDKGVAQGGLIETPEGNWFAFLFRDYGAVGRIPYLVPVQWVDGWPIIGEDGKVPETLDLPANNSLIPGIVSSDEFNRKKKDPKLPLVWQWNHNPNNDLWSLDSRAGYLRLTTGRIDNSIVEARNTLTQRTIGPECSGITSIDASGMKEGDFAGMVMLQQQYGYVGVTIEDGKKSILMVRNQSKGDEPKVEERIALNQDVLFLKVVGDFKERRDIATFYYSLDGKSWNKIGSELQMRYTLPHFMGYRFGLFNYATKYIGGYADFDYFRISDQIDNK